MAPEVPEGYRTFGPYLENIARAISGTFFPPGGDIGPSGEDVGVSRFLDRYMCEIPRQMSLGLKAFMVILDLMPIFFIYRPSRFCKLSLTERVIYLEKWQKHPIFLFRAAVLALKSICCFCYFADNDVRNDIGFYVVCVDGKRRKDI